MIDYKLADVEQRAREHHPMFRISDRFHRDNMRVGYQCKLVFEVVVAESAPRQPGAERMWVEIRRIELATAYTPLRYVGVLMNQPVHVRIGRGTEVTFGPEHIADWEPGP